MFLKVVIAEDQCLMREVTRRLLEAHGGLNVVGVGSDYDDVLAETRRLDETSSSWSSRCRRATWSREGPSAQMVS